jgi:hypothetical protein
MLESSFGPSMDMNALWKRGEKTMLTSQKPAPPNTAPPPAQADPKAMRRSSRLTIDIPVEVMCKSAQKKLHTEETRTMVVSAHGCALSLKTGVLPGDKVVLIHKISRQEITCRVVMCRSSKTNGWDTGLEFAEPAPNFWHIAFPPDDWDPSFRDSPAPIKTR